MTTPTARDYNCKDEELITICQFASASLKRDITDFSAYSPMFNQDYINTFDSDITAAINLVDPLSETLERKLLNDEIHTVLNDLLDPINRLTGYITLSPAIKITPADFGITTLRADLKVRNAEQVITGLFTVNLNITKYKDALTAQGMSDTLVTQFTTLTATITDDYQKQHEIVSNRRHIVQSNIAQLNNLNDQLTEILNVGKILYKSTDTAKLLDYTFTHLKNDIHPASKTPVTPPAPTPTTDTKQ